MIFSGSLLPLVLDGTKTVTRRRVKPGERSCRYQPGRIYAVQARRGARGVGHIRVNSTRREPFVALTDAEARREGFPDLAAMTRWWLERYGSVDGDVWRINFELVTKPIMDAA